MRLYNRPPVLVIVEPGGRLRAEYKRALDTFFERAPNFRVLEPATGADALAVAEIVDADLLIASDALTDMQGTEFYRRLRRMRQAMLLPVLTLSSDGNSGNESHLLAAGSDEYIRLPIAPALLEARILTMLRRKWASDEREDVESVLFALAQTVEQRDSFTGGHCLRLAELSVRMARRLGLDAEDTEALYRGGFLHDIGKLAVPDSILFKTGPLTMDEWNIIRKHTTHGEEICKPMRTLAPVLPIIRSHHERWDGSGYPDNLRGEEIPLLARILQIADIYDALTTVRPYKPALNHSQAVNALEEEAQLGWRDPKLVRLFIEMFPETAPPVLERRALTGTNADLTLVSSCSAG